MGRLKCFEYEKYICYDESRKISKCLFCEKELKGRNSSNIKRHYELIHSIKIVDNHENVHSTSSTGNLTKRKSTNINITMNKNEFLLCCVGLVTVKNIPFRIFDDECFFKKLIRPYEDIYNTNLNSKNIVEKVTIVAKNIKESIAKCVKMKMISLKIDVATRMEKSILIINIQYIKDSKIVINTIGMIQLRKRHKSQFLKEEIINCLKEYDIDVSQIYACTSDNGANVIKTSKLLAELQEESQTLPYEEPNSDDEDYLNIHSSLTSVLSVVRCAAHTIQLAAYDVLKGIQPQLEECRNIVKMIRTVIRTENIQNLNMPPIDNKTRWNSTYKMLKSLQSQKQAIENIGDSNIPDADWNFINQYLNAFRPLAECTDKFQREQYIIGDFYRDWLFCELELEEIKEERNPYAEDLLNAMNERKQCLLTNGAFVAAVYLDPRFNFAGTPFLNEEQKKDAVHHLLQTQEMIKSLNGQLQITQVYSSIALPSLSGPFAKLEAKINFLMERKPTMDRTTKQKLDNLAHAERMPFKTNILDFWKNTKLIDPELGMLIDVALAVPSTQVSVERAFSALSIILTKHGAKLSKETINNLLIIKLNNNLLQDLIITDESM